jgi:hypothetical protein
MEYWKNRFWDDVVLGYWSAKGGKKRVKIDNILLKTHYSIIPMFHYSKIEAKIYPQ